MIKYMYFNISKYVILDQISKYLNFISILRRKFVLNHSDKFFEHLTSMAHVPICICHEYVVFFSQKGNKVPHSTMPDISPNKIDFLIVNTEVATTTAMTDTGVCSGTDYLWTIYNIRDGNGYPDI